MVSKKELMVIRRDLKVMDDGSDEFKEMYNTFSWFLDKFVKHFGSKEINNIKKKVNEL